MGLVLLLDIILRAIWTLFIVPVAIPAQVIWLYMMRPLLVICPALFWWMEGHITRYLHACMATMVMFAGYSVAEVGDNIKRLSNDTCMLLVNHQSTADVPLVMYSSQNKGEAAKGYVWLVLAIFKYTPFGMLNKARIDPFIIEQPRGKQREKQTNQLRNYTKDIFCQVPQKRWLIVFPEGGFLYKKIKSSQKFAAANGLPVLHNVVLPRLGAVQSMIDVLHPKTSSPYAGKRHLDWIIDVTIGYPGGEAFGMLDMFTQPRASTTVVFHYTAYHIKDIPTDPEKVKEWMYDKYIQKEAMLETFYKTGHFPEKKPSPYGLDVIPTSSEGQRISMSPWWLVWVHCVIVSIFLVDMYAVLTLTKTAMYYAPF